MSGPLVPQVYVAQVRAERQRQHAIEADLRRRQAQRYAEVRDLARRQRRRLDARPAAAQEARS